MRKNVFAALVALLAICALYDPSARAGVLRVANETAGELLNVLVEPEGKGEKSFFMRLDLSPGAEEIAENPDCEANLRVDTGLELQYFKNIPLKSLTRVALCGKHGGCLELEKTNGEVVHENGTIKPLVPQKGDRPVCELDRFRPKMPMKEVCAILEPDLPTDDNNSLLTGLGFAGSAWAARLSPARDGVVGGDTPLEYLELRGYLSENSVFAILNELYKRGYAPWEAEFPDANMDFANEKGSEARLAEAVKKFLAVKEIPPKANPEDIEREATLMLAPAKLLPSLASADSPPEDAQLFTIILKPVSGTLIVDVAAYAAEPSGAK